MGFSAGKENSMVLCMYFDGSCGLDLTTEAVVLVFAAVGAGIDVVESAVRW